MLVSDCVSWHQDVQRVIVGHHQVKGLGGSILQVLTQAGLQALVGQRPFEIDVVCLAGCAAVEPTQLPQIQGSPVSHLPQAHACFTDRQTDSRLFE